MRKKTVLLLITAPIIASLAVYLVKISICPSFVILPTESNANKLTLVEYGGPFLEKITITHFTDETKLSEYVLALDAPVGLQVPQTYELPKLKNGAVEVIVNFEDSVVGGSGSLNVKYDNADLAFENGILIYTANDNSTYVTINGSVYCDQYIFFISGENKTAFVKYAGADNWEQNNNFSALEAKTKVFQESYFPEDDLWKKKNKWRKTFG